jgi:bacterial/archaeal transporter family-2 protein
VAFVALNSHAVPRLGAVKTTSFVVGAQMLTSVTIDIFDRPFSGATTAALGGAALIIAGVWMSASEAKRPSAPVADRQIRR